MSYSIYKNKKLLKELSEKDYRLLKFNSKLINPFHTYLMYSLVPSELNELSFKDLNSVVEIFKKKINKFVKKKFNKNYVNANAQKDLDIFTELCHLNISIFNNNFDNLHSSTKNKKYTKRLYLINRDNDLFLLIKKDKKGLKLKLGNNVLKPIQSGGGVKRKQLNTTNFEEKTFFNSEYYNNNTKEVFLKKYCEKLIGQDSGKEKLDFFKEIIIAVFTDKMRSEILTSIKNIQKYIIDNIRINARIIISGGSGFNNLNNIEQRPISPDIDVKLCLHTKEAIELHNHMTTEKKLPLNEVQEKQIIVARQLLVIRTHLFDAMKEEGKRLNNIIFELNKVNELNTMFKDLYEYCSSTLMGGRDIPFLNYLVDRKKFDVNQLTKVTVRETLMRRGIDGKPEEKKPYKLHDIFLYSLDLPFNNFTGYESLAGILDIVVSIPGHIGYILPDYSTNTLSTTLKCYNITVDYYKYELIKLVRYGLRTQNKKILKDLVRYRILLSLDPVLKGAKISDLRALKSVINSITDPSLKKELNLLLSDIMSIGMDNVEPSQITEVIQSGEDTQDEQLENILERCDIISNTSSNTDFDKKYNEMNQELEDYLAQEGSMEGFITSCHYYGYIEGGNPKHIGGVKPIDNVEVLSMSKVFQFLVNNISMCTFDKKRLKKLTLVEDINNEKYKRDIENQLDIIVHRINFEKLTEVKPMKKGSKDPMYVFDEYLSTKATKRTNRFTMSKNKDLIEDLQNICTYLADEVIAKGYINRLCYCYESDEYIPGSPNAPTAKEYAAFLLTQCQLLKTINETKNLYKTIDDIAKRPKGPSRVAPNMIVPSKTTNCL